MKYNWVVKARNVVSRWKICVIHRIGSNSDLQFRIRDDYHITTDVPALNDGDTIFSGCEYKSYFISVASTHLFLLDVEALTCTGNTDVDGNLAGNTNYTGFGFTKDINNTTLVMVFSNGKYGFIGEFQ